MAGEPNRRKSKKTRKGRPPGVKLTDEQQRQILSYVEAGGTLDATARAARISPRTLREIRQRARGDHPTRSPLPHLKAFFDDVDQAIGSRLLANEIWISEHDPKYSLKYLRASLASEGVDDEQVRLPTADELQQELDVLISSRALRVPRCKDESCACVYHQAKGEAS